MKRKYPWEEWFDKRFAVLLRGVDYHCSQSTMVQSIRNRASRAGLRVSVEDTGTEVILVVVGSVKDEISHTKTEATVTRQCKNALEEVG